MGGGGPPWFKQYREMETGFRELAEGESQEIGWPTVPVCPALRGLPECRTSSAKTEKVPEYQDKLVTLTKDLHVK